MNHHYKRPRDYDPAIHRRRARVHFILCGIALAAFAGGLVWSLAPRLFAPLTEALAHIEAHQ